MADKLTEQLEIPRCVRSDELLRKKLAICMTLRDRNLSQQVRHSLSRGVDQEMSELGQKAFDMLCREMSEVPPGPKRAEPMSVDAGKRRRAS